MATSLNFEYLVGLTLTAANSIEIVTGLDALVKKCEQRLRFLLGEWFLDTTQGVPYFQQIYADSIDPTLIVTILNNELQKEDDITSISDVDFTFDDATGAFTYKASIQTVYGDDTVSVEIQ